MRRSARTASLPDSRRSELMSRIRQRGTAPELAVATLLAGMRRRPVSNAEGLPGAPDFVDLRRRTALFVHGCFWHRHPGCKAASTPKSNSAFWGEKFRQNVARDRRVARQLRALGYRVAIIWECQTKTSSGTARLDRRLRRLLSSQR